MLDRETVLSMLMNQGGQSASAKQLKAAILAAATNAITKNDSNHPLLPPPDSMTQEEQARFIRNQDRRLLNSFGPAAASAAMDSIIRMYQGRGRGLTTNFNGHFANNVNLIHNSPEEFPGFSNVLRQFLLPRYAYLDFDQIVDPRHKIDAECGYPKFITPIMYRYMYDRDDVARRVVDVYPNESWTVDPVVTESPDHYEPTTGFEKKWAELCDTYDMLSYLYRIDRLAGIGHYGALLLGLDDGKDLEAPIDEAELLAGFRQSTGKKQRQLLYMRPFDEYLSFIHQYETDVMSPRYGLPKFYNLVFLDMTIDAAGASIGTRLNRRVHWTRVIHVVDNLMSSLVFGIPRQQSVFNRLLDLRKIKGGGAEMFWKGAFPGLAFEVDPKFIADNPTFDKDAAREEVERYFDGLQRAIFNEGIKCTTLQPAIVDDPNGYFDMQMKSIAMALEMPLRVFMGSEGGRHESEQDSEIWNKRLSRRDRRYITPKIIRNTIDRFIAIGVMPPPDSGSYQVLYPDRDTPTNEDKANLALKWSQAMSQYVASGMIHLMQPIDYFTIVMGFKPSDAKRLADAIDKNGGLSKLKSVDPSQGAGVNGKRQDIAGGNKSQSGSRDSADKKQEGMAS